MNRRSGVLHHIMSVCGGLIILFGSTLPVSAATTTSKTAPATGAGNGIKISPVHSDITINPGNSATLDVYVTNVTAQAATFQIIANDFVASGDESGNPAVILNPNQSAPAHGLKQYVTPINNVTIQPDETKDIKVTINMPAKVAPGGYYGAIRVASANSNQASDKNITLSASVASLILVRVPGDLKEQVSVASFDARNGNHSRSIFTSNKGIDAVVRLQNEGNIQEQPFGKITVKNMQGKQIGSYEINNTDPKGNILPDSIRRFGVPLKNLNTFGRYTLTGNFGYANGQLLSASSTFYIIPIPLIITLIVLVVLIVIAIFEVPRLIKSYNKRVIRRANRG